MRRFLLVGALAFACSWGARIDPVDAPGALVETLSLKTKRCADQSYAFTSLPEKLAGKTTLAFRRGSDASPFSGARVGLGEDGVLFLFVQRRGDAGIPAPWVKLGLTATWKVGAYTIVDEVYMARFEAGIVEIPGHPGKDGGKYGIPHLVVAAGAVEDADFLPVATGIKTSWPKQVSGAPVPSRLWEAFRDESRGGKNPALPDFSYAGYHQGTNGMQAKGTRFPVTDYGAKPDDLLDDGEGIQRAIDACAASGGGIVFLPRGRYLVNTSMARRIPIQISNSGIVLKGEGATNGGTIIHQVHPFETGVPPSDNRHYHLGQTVFSVRSPADESPFAARPTLARLTAFSSNEPFAIEVDSTEGLVPGQDVVLFASNAALLMRMLAPRSPAEAWVNLQKSPLVAERHQIATLRGKRVAFREPTRYPLAPEDGWVLKPSKPIREVGFEDLCFMGNAYARYVHHRNDLEDSGWASIRFRSVNDGWIRRCAFIDVSQVVNISHSSHVSMLNLFVLGNQGHHIPRIGSYSYGVLGGLMEDRAGFTHGPSVSHAALGTVYWRCRIAANQPIDSHAGRPFVTLFDRIDGGSLFGSTGGLRDFPQHMRKMVIWNFRHGVETGSRAPFFYDFWHNANTGIFLDPIIAGLHGKPAEFNEETLESLESLGTPVSPESLYEAQLALRLGTAPAWIAEARREHDVLRVSPFPARFDRRDTNGRPFSVPETFRMEDALKFATSKAMRFFGKEFFTFTLEDPSLRFTGDLVLLRHAIYTGMAIIFESSKNGNSIAVGRKPEGGGERVRLIISAGAAAGAGLDLKALQASDDGRSLENYARLLRGKLRFFQADGKGSIELVLPVR